MAKKLSESSRQGKPIRVNVDPEKVFNKPLTGGRGARSKKLAELPDSEIDYSDIPQLSEEQLAKAVQPNRAREVIGVRLDWDVLYWLKNYGPGHTTRINNILRVVMEKDVAARKAGKRKRSRNVA